jgi:hypothetical protein
MYLLGFASEWTPQIGPLATNQYRCDECGNIYNEAWTEEEALEEMKQNGWVKNECGIVCDDCYKALGFGGQV